MRKTASFLLAVFTAASLLTPRIAGAALPGRSSAVGTSLLSNGDFEQADLAPWVFNVVQPVWSSIKQDTAVAASGRASARISVYQPGAPTNVTLAQHGLSLTAGLTYSLTFSARGYVSQTIDAGVQQDAASGIWRANQSFSLTNTWQQYSLSFIAPVTESAVKVQFNFGQAIGWTWIDAVVFAPTSDPTTATATGTGTVVPPTATSTVVPSTATSTGVPPTTTSTNTPPPPTASATATSTSVPSTATSTGVPSTASSTNTPTPPTATNTPIQPTITPTSVPSQATGTSVPATATATPAGSGPAGTVQDFPRLASLYSYDSMAQASTFARYGLVVAPVSAGGNGSVQALKNRNSASKTSLYLDSSAVDVPGFGGMTIYPGWWLTLAGTVLTAPIGPASTTVQVANAGLISGDLATSHDVLVDGESMHVIAVNAGTNTLTVQRGYASTATAHATGARLATHASNWPGAWMLNLTPYCPANPATGQTWKDYLVRQATGYLSSAPWDGIFYDNANTSWASFANGQLDANNDNVADGGNGPSGTGWQDGEAALFTLTRSLSPGALLLGNGGYYSGSSTGEEMEHFPYYANGWSNAFTSYLQVAGPNAPSPSTIVNADTANTGTQNLQSMRFNLATALMGNGYYAYDYGSQDHGQTWWYDEYDNGAGSSLATAVTAFQTSLSLAAGSGSKFRVGDVLWVPDATGAHDDEQILVTGIGGDTLAVQRGYGGSQTASHAQGAKVLTQAQLAAGQGWLGQPLAAAASLSQGGPAMGSSGDFEAGGSGWSDGWSLNVSSPAAASVSQDIRTAASGHASARIAVTSAVPGSSWDATLTHGNLAVTGGTAYTLSFWAKGSAGESIGAGVQQDAAPWSGLAYQSFTLTGTWQRYSVSFTAAVTTSPVRMQFNLAGTAGTIWLDNVSFQQGDPNIWRRDFAHGTVLLNGTNSPQTVTLGPGYRRIAGTQDPATNSGSAVTSLTIAPLDAILLAKAG